MRPQPDELELLAAWQAGDRWAGSTLVQRHSARIFKLFSKRGGRLAEVAEDLTQDVWCAVLANRERINGSFGGYVTGIAVNTLRKACRPGRLEFGLVESDVAAPGPEALDTILAGHDEDLASRALRSLDMEDQILIELRYLEEMTAADVADAMTTARGSIHYYVSRALGRLAEKLEDLQRESFFRSRWHTLRTWKSRVLQSAHRRFGPVA